MEVWAPAGLYLSPNSHTRCRQQEKKVSCLGRNGDPHPSYTTPPEASHYVRLHNGPRDQRYMISTHTVKTARPFTLKSPVRLYTPGCVGTSPGFRNASFYSISGNQRLIKAASISCSRGRFMLKCIFILNYECFCSPNR